MHHGSPTGVAAQPNNPVRPLSSDFARQARAEWELFFADPIRANELADASADINLRRVLDVGCGGGQELIPFVRRGAKTIGIDLSIEVGDVTRELHSTLGYPRKPAFICGAGEALPFRDGAFDVVVCRLALPYMEIRTALAEMIRVLQLGGVLILQVHAARYYVETFISGFVRGNLRRMKHAIKAVIAGAVYHLYGRHLQSRLLGKETFQSEWQLRREVKNAGGKLRRRLPVANKRAPVYLISKSQADSSDDANVGGVLRGARIR
jgi:ubiquinone/menaquinone biosynthesis C-methylase UbiE